MDFAGKKSSKMPIRKCVLCKSTPSSNVSLFRFPSNPLTKKFWLEFCNLRENAVIKNTRLCSRHFRKKCFKHTIQEGRKLVLQTNAIPTVKDLKEEEPHRLILNGITVSEMNTVAKDSKKYKKRDAGNSTHSRVCYICGVISPTFPRFSFPSDLTVRSQWAKFCGSDLSEIKPSHRICKNHFTDKDFKNVSNRLLLKKCVVPSLNPKCNDSDDIRIIGEDRNRNPNENVIYIISEDKDEIISENTCRIINENTIGIEDITIKEESDSNDTTVTGSMDISENISMGDHSMSTPNTHIHKFPRYLGDFHTPDMDVPTKARLCLKIARQTVSTYRENIAKLKRGNRMLKKKIIGLEETVQNMRNNNLIGESAAENLTVLIKNILQFITTTSTRSKLINY